MTTKITTELIDSSAITEEKLANDSVTAVKIAANAVGSSEIADGAVTNAKITSMAASKLTGALPAIDGSNLTGVEPPTTYNAIGTYTAKAGNATVNSTTTNIGITGLTGTWRCMASWESYSDGSGLYTTHYWSSLWVKIAN
jgi:hypothetical protein